MAGYSGTPLARKLGVGPGQRILLDRAPPSVVATIDPDGTLAASATVLRRLARDLDLVVTFHDDGATLRRRVAELEQRLVPAGAIWMAWPKKASGVPTDITGDRLREWFLPAGRLVDVKVCAIDDVWSGLKFVIRTSQR